MNALIVEMETMAHGYSTADMEKALSHLEQAFIETKTALEKKLV